jgi:hypothetical protein
MAVHLAHSALLLAEGYHYLHTSVLVSCRCKSLEW